MLQKRASQSQQKAVHALLAMKAGVVVVGDAEAAAMGEGEGEEAFVGAEMVAAVLKKVQRKWER